MNDDAVITRALKILQKRFEKTDYLTSPSTVFDYLRIKLAPLEYEIFVVIYLNTQNQIIEYQEMFRGTLSQTSVYPREVVKEALRHNAAAVVFAHNHPSGVEKPSSADHALTNSLKTALALVDVRVLDHVVVAGGAYYSFAEQGLI